MRQLAYLAVIASFCVVPCGVSAKVTRGTGIYVAKDSSAAGASLPASALNLLVGATNEGTVLTSTPGDDASYPLDINGIALFDMFNNPAGQNQRARVNSNGFISFDRNFRSECTTPFNNTDLEMPPSCRAKMAMPFWDDLIPVDALSTITWGSTSGTAADFWYVQWNDFALLSNPAARLTFRVTYFEATRHLRFNYIKLTGTGTDATGATIGVTQCHARGGNAWDNRTRPRVVVGYNASILPSGTATVGSSLFAIEFDQDIDGDTLLASQEAAAGTNDNLFDTDGCGEGDAAEVAAGRNPLTPDCTASPDDDTTDPDADGLVTGDENLVGSNPNVADTDGDTANDADEVKNMRTNPIVADTDGDGWGDGVEDVDHDGVFDENEDINRNGLLDGNEDADGDSILDLAESNPKDASSIPSTQLVRKGEMMPIPNQAQIALDANGNAHIVADERSEVDEGRAVLYWLVKPNGQIGISQSIIHLANRTLRKPQVLVSSGKVYLVSVSPSMPVDEGNGDSLLDAQVGFIRLDVSTHPLDGSPLSPANIEVNRSVSVPGIYSHHHAILGQNDEIHVIYESYLGNSRFLADDAERDIRYARLNSNGDFLNGTLLAHFLPMFELNENHSVRLAMGPDGRVHAIWHANVDPRNQTNDYAQFPNGLYYAVSQGDRFSAPAYLGHGRIERADLAIMGNLMYLMTSNKRNDGDDFYQGQGIRFALIDLNAMSLLPRTGDAFGVEWAVAAGSFITPFTTVFADGNGYMGGKVIPLPNHNAFVTFSDRNFDALGVVSVSPYGQNLSQQLRLRGSDRDDYARTRRKNLVPWATDFAAVQASWDNGYPDARFVVVKGSTLSSPDQAAINFAPYFTSTPAETEVIVGQVFDYQTVVTDDSTPAANLQWYIVAGPADAVLSSAGRFTWTPHASDAGDWLVTLSVCDDHPTQRRCGEQSFVLRVPPGLDNHAPQIVGEPPTEAFVGRLFDYVIDVQDADFPNETFTYNLDSAPVGNMNLTNGRLTWTPTKDDIGIVSIAVRVTDSSGAVATQAFSVTIRAGVFAENAGGAQITVDEGCGCRNTSGSTWIAILMLGTFISQRRLRSRAL